MKNEKKLAKLFAVVGACFGLLGVALGAFGAHALSTHFGQYPSLEPTYQTASRYLMYHALALLAVAWANGEWVSKLLNWAGYLLIAGTIIFSGSLFILSTMGLSWMGAVAPIGGTSLMAGWFCLGFGIWRNVD